MTCGAPTTRASSCSPIVTTATTHGGASVPVHLRGAVALCLLGRAFQEFGLPRAIRTDTGPVRQRACAVEALRVVAAPGHQIERIKPGHPEQNGRHELHLTLKKEATKPAAQNFLQQQAKFDAFIDCYNRERPHQALGMKYPAELYRRDIVGVDYPFHDRTVTITQCGRICIGKRKINFSQVFAGQNASASKKSPTASGRDLHALRPGILRSRDRAGRTRQQPVRAQSVTHVSGINRYPCNRNGPAWGWRARQDSNL